MGKVDREGSRGDSRGRATSRVCAKKDRPRSSGRSGPVGKVRQKGSSLCSLFGRPLREDLGIHCSEIFAPLEVARHHFAGANAVAIGGCVQARSEHGTHQALQRIGPEKLVRGAPPEEMAAPLAGAGEALRMSKQRAEEPEAERVRASADGLNGGDLR